ncbi:hypothetical protein J6590_106935 [Homalodisca vitripennis]|nr:hypothetical protein J6590_106935 [Homalodisca vitripennis]
MGHFTNLITELAEISYPTLIESHAWQETVCDSVASTQKGRDVDSSVTEATSHVTAARTAVLQRLQAWTWTPVLQRLWTWTSSSS